MVYSCGGGHLKKNYVLARGAEETARRRGKILLCLSVFLSKRGFTGNVPSEEQKGKPSRVRTSKKITIPYMLFSTLSK